MGETIRVPFAEADQTVRNYAYAAWVCGGYNPLDSVFWGIFHTKPISDERWPLYQKLLIEKYPDGVIEMPVGFAVWKWSEKKGKWVSY